MDGAIRYLLEREKLKPSDFAWAWAFPPLSFAQIFKLRGNLVPFMLSKQEALRLLGEQVSRKDKRRHMIAVSAIMRGLAKRLHADEREWELVGLLHDIDWDKIEGDMSRHGLVASEMLEGKLSEEDLHAIRAHDHRSGIKPESVLDRALIASDAISNFIAATAAVMPNRRLSQITVDTLKDKFKDESFTYLKHRPYLGNLIRTCEEIGLPLEEFFHLALKSLQEVSDEMGQ